MTEKGKFFEDDLNPDDGEYKYGQDGNKFELPSYDPDIMRRVNASLSSEEILREFELISQGGLSYSEAANLGLVKSNFGNNTEGVAEDGQQKDEFEKLFESENPDIPEEEK